jgi:hypothetical protein
MIATGSDPTIIDAIESPTSMKDWRVMGMWNDGREFLLTLADSIEDAMARLGASIDDFTREELHEVSSAWLERWVYDDFFRDWRWEPVHEIPLRRYRLRVAAKEQHAARRSA